MTKNLISRLRPEIGHGVTAQAGVFRLYALVIAASMQKIGAKCVDGCGKVEKKQLAKPKTLPLITLIGLMNADKAIFDIEMGTDSTFISSFQTQFRSVLLRPLRFNGFDDQAEG